MQVDLVVRVDWVGVGKVVGKRTQAGRHTQVDMHKGAGKGRQGQWVGWSGWGWLGVGASQLHTQTQHTVTHSRLSTCAGCYLATQHWPMSSPLACKRAAFNAGLCAGLLMLVTALDVRVYVYASALHAYIFIRCVCHVWLVCVSHSLLRYTPMHGSVMLPEKGRRLPVEPYL